MTRQNKGSGHGSQVSPFRLVWRAIASENRDYGFAPVSIPSCGSSRIRRNDQCIARYQK
jgi:hypothetical protein